jgi:phage-related protein
MYPHNFKVERLDGTVYDMETIGMIVNGLDIESPTPIHYREKIEGRSGYIDLGTEYDGRKIQARVTMIAVDNIDFPLLRDEVFRIFDSREPFYLLPYESPGKRILVKYDSPYLMARKANTGEFQLTFSSAGAYFESIGTTLDPFTFDSEMWQTGQGLTLDETMYTHSNSTFQIYNAADGVTIDPRNIPLLITFKGASTNLQIKNLTTGDTWSYTGTTTASDTIKLDGIRSLKNNASIFGYTNRKLITLAPGYNDFELTGTSGSFTVSFDFRFYSL